MATRQAILESAHRAFVESGYEAGVREIAERAGVTAMLVNRYFGSKEGLFEEVLDTVLARPGILTQALLDQRTDLQALCRALAAALVARTAPDDAPLDGFLIMLRSANNRDAAVILRRKFEHCFGHRLAALLPGADAAARAGILLALIAGVQLMRQVVELDSLTRADPARLAARIETLLGVLANGED